MQVRKVFKRKERAQSSYESRIWCAFLLNKGKDGGGKKESVPVGTALGHYTLSATEREREQERSILSPINLSSSGFIYFTVFSFSCLHKLFFLQSLYFSHYTLLSVKAGYCCGNSREGTMRVPTPNSVFLSLGCQSYFCQVSFTVQ